MAEDILEKMGKNASASIFLALCCLDTKRCGFGVCMWLKKPEQKENFGVYTFEKRVFLFISHSVPAVYIYCLL